MAEHFREHPALPLRILAPGPAIALPNKDFQLKPGHEALEYHKLLMAVIKREAWATSNSASIRL